MWAKTCAGCRHRQLFGFRHLVALENGDTGVITMRWSCPECKTSNQFVTGVSTCSAA